MAFYASYIELFESGMHSGLSL